MEPIGKGHAQAMFRLGLRELRNAMNPSKESVADTEPGLYGTVSSRELYEQQHTVETRKPDTAEKAQETQRENQSKGPEMER